MIQRKYRYGIVIAVLIILIAFVNCLSLPSKTIEAKNGVVDLSGIDFSQRENYRLDGDWEFYWEQLLSYKDLQNSKPDLYADIPDTWNHYELNGETLPGQGYATYRLHIITDLPENTQLGLRLNSFSSAFSLYIDEDLIASIGSVATDASEEIGKYKPQAVYFNVPASEFDIIIQVSNYEFAKGGFWNSLYIGNAEHIGDLNNYIIGIEMLLIGVLVIIAIFYLALYLMILKTEFNFYLNSSCLWLLTAVMADTVGTNAIVGSIPGLSFKMVIFLWYLSTNWVPFFLILVTHKLFESKFSAITVKVYLIFSLAFQMFFILMPTNVYTRFADVGDLHDLLGYICSALIVAIGIKKGYRDGWMYLSSMIIVLICYIHDSLNPNNSINDPSGDVLLIGIFIFTFLQMLIQVNRLKQFFESNAATELKFLQAQIKPHFLYNAINTFIAISYYDIDKTRALMTNFGNYLRGSFDFMNQNQFVTLKSEIKLAEYYVSIEEARFEERLEVKFDVDCDMRDMVPNMVLEPIIENAINHGVLPKEAGGRVDISIIKKGKTLAFRVRDSGVGMMPEALNKIIEHESVSGVGLHNINSRLIKLYGKGLEINSRPGEGTEVAWTVPINGKKVKRQSVESGFGR